MPKPLLPDEDDKILDSTHNPLADYKGQITENLVPRYQYLEDTSLFDDIGRPFLGLPDNHKIYFKQDLASYEYSKIIAGAANRRLIMSLDSNSMKLFLWVVFELDYRCETVKLNPKKMKAIGFKMSHNTFIKALGDLEEKKIIKRVDKRPKMPDYWKFHINPQIVWKGDAKEYYKDVLKAFPHYGWEFVMSDVEDLIRFPPFSFKNLKGP